MADNVTAPFTGTGDDTKVIATDELGDASHAQKMKLLDGTANSTEVIPGDAANGLDVDVTRIADGADVSLGAKADAEATGNGSLIAIVKRLRTLLGTIITSLNGGLPAALVGGRLDVNVGAQAARVATTDTITAKLATDKIQDGTTALTPKFAHADVAASQTDSNIVTGVGGKKIRVLQVVATCGGTGTDLTFNSKGAGAGTSISGKLSNGANGGEVLPFSPVGWFETITAEALTVTTGAGSSTGITLTYVEV